MAIERTEQDVAQFNADMDRIAAKKQTTTATATHTPGPWHSRSLTGRPITRIYGGGEAAREGCRGVCDIHYAPERQAEKAANVRLIAAAPDAHAILAYIMEHIRHGGSTIHLSALLDDDKTLGKAVQDYIAKVAGK